MLDISASENKPNKESTVDLPWVLILRAYGLGQFEALSTWTLLVGPFVRIEA